MGPTCPGWHRIETLEDGSSGRPDPNLLDRPEGGSRPASGTNLSRIGRPGSMTGPCYVYDPCRPYPGDANPIQQSGGRILLRSDISYPFMHQIKDQHSHTT